MAEALDCVTFVNTVLGSTRISEFGITLTHEHLLGDCFKLQQEYPNPFIIHNLNSLWNLGYVRLFPYSYPSNLVLNDKEGENATIDDVKLFQKSNGRTIVDKNSRLHRNIELLQRLSYTTSVNIIVGTGYHITDSNNLSTCRTTTEEMYNEIHFEFENGCIDCPIIKPAFVADGGNIHYNFEKRALRAIGEFQGQYRVPVSFHPGTNTDSLIEILRIYQEAGGIAKKFVMSHIDRTLNNEQKFCEFIDQTECYLQFDQFGVESSFYQWNALIDVMSDAQSIKYISYLKENQKLHRVFMSHDIHTKHRLIAFGGHGYVHITENIVPIMLRRNFSMEDIQMIRAKNPFRWLNRATL